MLCALLVLGSCRDQDPLQPSSIAAPPLKPSSAIAVAGWVPMFANAPGSWETADVADMNADGKTDLVRQDRTARETGVLFMGGTTVRGSSPMTLASSSDWQIVGATDMSGDWKPDVVWQNRATREVGAWIMDGTTFRRWVVIGSASSSDWEIGGVADMTGDWKPDIVWQNRVTREVGLWVMDGTTFRSWIVLGSASSSEWEIGGAADMDLDGMADIVWQNRATREVGAWLMNRTSLRAWVVIGSASSSEWRIGGVGDMNGDWQPDIVWQNLATRENGVWILGGASRPPPSPPSEARHRVGYTSFRTAPYGFKGATPWIAAVHTGDPSVPSAVDIDYIQLWAEIDGVYRPVAYNYYDDDGVFAGELGDRSPWFASPTRPMPGTISNGVLTIRPGDQPQKVWHPYLESWPGDRYDLSRATRVSFVAIVRLHGPVAVQAGIDYYEQLGYPAQPRRVEGAVTDWVSFPEQWITLSIERSTEVVGPIELWPAAPDNRYPVGSTIAASFVVHNMDDDTIRLTGLGIETRRLPAGDTHCDPEKLERVEAFIWAVNVDLAPGGGIRHAAQWRPTVAGDYCIRVVEQRRGVKHDDGSPVYQQPYSSTPFQVIRVR